MKNKIIAVIAGVISGWVIVALGNFLSASLYPAPPNMDFTDKSALKAFIDSLPTTAFLLMVLIWAISVFAGGWITGTLAKENWQRLSIITGVVLLLANIANMFVIPQPMWMNITAILMYIPLAYLGGRMSDSKRRE